MVEVKVKDEDGLPTFRGPTRPLFSRFASAQRTASDVSARRLALDRRRRSARDTHFELTVFCCVPIEARIVSADTWQRECESLHCATPTTHAAEFPTGGKSGT